MKAVSSITGHADRDPGALTGGALHLKDGAEQLGPLLHAGEAPVVRLPGRSIGLEANSIVLHHQDRILLVE